MLNLGVHRSGKKYTAAVYAPGTRGCTMKLYNSGSADPAAVVGMHEDPLHRGVFCCEFESDADEYVFEGDRGNIPDPYARVLNIDRTHCVLEKKPFVINEPVFVPADYPDLIIYKLHVRGFTAHESSGVRYKGTFKGIAAKLPYLKSLGINAVLLMPCYDFNPVIGSRGEGGEVVNFWGYGAEAAYFAPKASYASEPGRVREEFASVVKALHANGIAVFTEMDFPASVPGYRVLEVLRFWHDTYHIDGFRVIGSSVPAKMIADDPCLMGVRLISDYWNDECIAARGRDNTGLADCNDGFMINVRRFIKGDEGQVSGFAENVRSTGGGAARVNYIADHNGFTLADVYSYDERHNEANGEKNRDGREINYSWNCGVEGPTNSRHILKLRTKMIKNALTVLFLSQGTPMLMAGDEFGCTHGGNNNPYCCDNEQGWVVWEKGTRARELRDYTVQLIKLRQSHRVLSNVVGLRGTDYVYSGCPDISFHGTSAWYPDYGYYSRTLGVLLNGEYARVDRIRPDASFYIIYNMHWQDHVFDLPTINKGSFRLLLSTDPDTVYTDGRTCEVRARSAAVFVSV